MKKEKGGKERGKHIPHANTGDVERKLSEILKTKEEKTEH